MRVRDVVFKSILFLIWISAGGWALYSGHEYYLIPIPQRAYSDLAPIYSPTGLVGQGLGILGTLMTGIGVLGYAARKRSRRLARLGSLQRWLAVHIFLCTLGPFFILLHTTFKFGGLVSVAFWSMAIVVVSGVFGRYVYVRIPKTRNGRFLGMEAVRGRILDLATAIRDRAGLNEADVHFLLGSDDVEAARRGTMGALAFAVAEGTRDQMRLFEVRRLLRERSIPTTVRRPLLSDIRERNRLRRQALLLHPFQRLFRYWHVLHLPLAIVMFLILAVHVSVAVLFGYTWIFAS